MDNAALQRRVAIEDGRKRHAQQVIMQTAIHIYAKAIVDAEGNVCTSRDILRARAAEAARSAPFLAEAFGLIRVGREQANEVAAAGTNSPESQFADAGL